MFFGIGQAEISENIAGPLGMGRQLLLGAHHRSPLVVLWMTSASRRRSRQGLYLYFDTKDFLFREALQYLVSHMISTARSVAEDGNLSLRDRLLGVFEAVNGSAFHNASREDAFELLQSPPASIQG
jgi:hypothetical protein